MVTSTLLDDLGLEMTGDEMFPIIGCQTLPVENLMSDMMHSCKGLNPYWDCLKKAWIVKRFMKSGQVVCGSLYVWNDAMDANYGYEYNPPFELHAWWRLGSMIIDIALPGVIQKGMKTIDALGPIITGRKPVILYGQPESWMVYKPYEVLGE